MFRLGKTKLRFYLILRNYWEVFRCDSGILITLRRKESFCHKNNILEYLHMKLCLRFSSKNNVKKTNG